MFFWVAIIVISLLIYWTMQKWSGSQARHTKAGPVLITGCDTGFGHMLALKLLENGFHVFAACLTEIGESTLNEKGQHLSGKLHTLRMDVTDDDSINQCLAIVKKDLGVEKGLWGLVNNAAIAGHFAPDDWLNVTDYQRVMEVNFFGVVRVTQAFKLLLKLGKGRIIITTSVLGRVAIPICGPYDCSKYATEAYADVLRRELKPFDVSVHILTPGAFATNIISGDVLLNDLDNMWQRLPTEAKSEYNEGYLKELSEVVRNFVQLAETRLHLVVDAYYHALTSPTPRLRYHIGNDAKCFYIPISLMPTWLGDYLMDKIAIINRVKLPLPKCAVVSADVGRSENSLFICG